MGVAIDTRILEKFRHSLDTHPIYAAVQNLQDLQIFMSHHVYSVWDFMSLIKYLQSLIAPTSYPWTPRGDGNVRRFINELVLEEESDETTVSGEHSSHFELYQQAMLEIGGSTACISEFITAIETNGLQQALQLDCIPPASRRFTGTTFEIIQQNKPHQVAAALALGREHIIPGMFRSILKKTGVTDKQAPVFHYYLNRHIHLDEDFHAPLSLKLLNSLCDNDPVKIDEALDAADRALKARLQFWDGVQDALQEKQLVT